MSAKDNNRQCQWTLILFVIDVSICWQKYPVCIKEKVYYYYYLVL